MKIITTTTINPVTDEIRLYDEMENWHLIVIGDRKSPEYKLERGRFVSWEEQRALYPELCKLIGPDNTQRGRMIAFLEARKHDPELVASIDDDCEPYKDWPGPIYVGREISADFHELSTIAFDPVGYLYGIPARGFPPQLSHNGHAATYKRMQKITPLIQENFWDGQPDVDAVWRLHEPMMDHSCSIDRPFWSNAFSPINTQNTIIHGSVLKDHCGEIPFVGHVSDIWAGYLFQAYHPNSTIYAPSTVRHWQERTYESVLKDLQEEMYSYRFALDFLNGLKEHGPAHLGKIPCLPSNAREAITLYRSYFV